MGQCIHSWSERAVCAALGRCRQNVVATVNGVFSLFDPVTLLQERIVLGFWNFGPSEVHAIKCCWQNVVSTINGVFRGEGPSIDRKGN